MRTVKTVIKALQSGEEFAVFAVESASESESQIDL